MTVVPFIPAHLDGFDLQEEQVFMNKYLMSEDYIIQLTDMNDAYSIVYEGKVYAIAGCCKVYDHLGMVWALLSKDTSNLYGVTKEIRKWLDSQDIPRMETAVRRDFEKGHRWARLLGFVNETPETGMKKFGLNGETCDLYARY